MEYIQKCSTATKIADIDKKKGIVIFYTSIFGNKDSDGDVIEQGAFAKTLKENFTRIRHLKDHRISIGLPLQNETFEDSTGLRVASKLFLGKQEADEIFIEYQTYAELGNLMEHSFGFNPVADKMFYDNLTNTNYIKEVKLWEVTTMTTWGANSQALQVGLKNLNFNELNTQMQILRKMLNAEIRDARKMEFETQLNTIEQILKNSQSTFGKKPDYSNKKNSSAIIKLI